jgi:polyphosphate kinase
MVQAESPQNKPVSTTATPEGTDGDDGAASSSREAVSPAAADAAMPWDRGGSEEFLNRELIWLEFNRRVLHQALDPRTPLLERLGFMAIFNSNLDEFFQKRVGGLKRQIAAGLNTRSNDGMTPQQQLRLIRQMVLEMLDQQAYCFEHELKPALAERDIHLVDWPDLSAAEREQANRYFQDTLFPVLTPLAVDPGHPFPFISNLSKSLGVMLRPPETGTEQGAARARPGFRLPNGRVKHFARVKVPQVLPQWIQLSRPNEGEQGHRFVRLEQIIQHNLDQLFEGMTLDNVEPFRITRNADVEREEDAEDLLELIEQEVRDRRFARCVRLEGETEIDHPINQFLMGKLGLDEQDVYRMPAELDYTDLWTVHAVNEPELKYEPWTSVLPPRLADEDADIFSIIRSDDVMVHHPYESFSASVERFIREAVNDPNVIAIKQTLYRTSKDSPFIPELIRAAEAGKQVVCLVELKARFDEAANVQIASKLEKAGVHVVYGLVGYKTHTKTSLVVRQESDGVRTYAHIGTGNYNSKTAGLYTDLGLLTCDPRLTGDLVQLFHYLTGRSIKHHFDHLLIAPTNMRTRFMELIDREIAYCDDWEGRGGTLIEPDRPRIVAKMNALEDRDLCRKLYEASQAGVSIDLIVRGFCCLRPGVEGMSENIRVISIIGRFLEHARIFYFHNGGTPDYFIGSADWMYRNLNNRIECITPIYDHAAQDRLAQALDIMLADQRQAWDMQPDGSYVQRQPDLDQPETERGTQGTLMRLARQEAGQPVDDGS